MALWDRRSTGRLRVVRELCGDFSEGDGSSVASNLVLGYFGI